MLERILEPYSVDAADAADRLRLIKCDLQTVELAVAGAVNDDDDRCGGLSLTVKETKGVAES